MRVSVWSFCLIYARNSKNVFFVVAKLYGRKQAVLIRGKYKTEKHESGIGLSDMYRTIMDGAECDIGYGKRKECRNLVLQRKNTVF